MEACGGSSWAASNNNTPVGSSRIALRFKTDSSILERRNNDLDGFSANRLQNGL